MTKVVVSLREITRSVYVFCAKNAITYRLLIVCVWPAYMGAKQRKEAYLRPATSRMTISMLSEALACSPVEVKERIFNQVLKLNSFIARSMKRGLSMDESGPNVSSRKVSKSKTSISILFCRRLRIECIRDDWEGVCEFD